MFFSIIAVLLVDDTFESKEHRLSIKPPAGWQSERGRSPTVIKFVSKEDYSFKPTLLVIQFIQHPTTLADQIKKIKEFRTKAHKNHTLVFESEQKAPYKLVTQDTDTEIVEVMIPRGMREFLIIQSRYPKSESKKFLSIFDQTVASLKLLEPPKPEKSVLEKSWKELTKLDPIFNSKIPIHHKDKKVGEYLFSCEKKGELFSFKIDCKISLDSNSTYTLVKSGSFSQDLKTQSLEILEESTLKSDKFKRKVTIQTSNGQFIINRKVNDHTEERKLSINETVIEEIAEALVAPLSLAGKNIYTFKTINAYDDDPYFCTVQTEEKTNDGKKDIFVTYFTDRFGMNIFWVGTDTNFLKIPSWIGEITIRNE